MIMTGVANTGGSIASLKRLARCSGWTRRLNEPLAPTGIGLMTCPLHCRRDELPPVAADREPPDIHACHSPLRRFTEPTADPFRKVAKILPHRRGPVPMQNMGPGPPPGRRERNAGAGHKKAHIDLLRLRADPRGERHRCRQCQGRKIRGPVHTAPPVDSAGPSRALAFLGVRKMAPFLSGPFCYILGELLARHDATHPSDCEWT